MDAIDAQLIVRDPALQLTRLRAQLARMGVTAGGHKDGAFDGHRDLWVFGYASLIWRPEFDAAEHRPALVHGWHRCLRMRSRINRGTPQEPGLVFALVAGGTCRGVAYRLRHDRLDHELERLWKREMTTGVYDARVLAAQTAHGTVPALAFTLDRRSDAYIRHLPDEQMLHILRHARGRFGSTLEYMANTSHALRQHGVHDRELERLMGLARHHGLLQDNSPRTDSRSATVSTSTSTPASSSSHAHAG